jgi:hypothetical protein
MPLRPTSVYVDYRKDQTVRWLLTFSPAQGLEWASHLTEAPATAALPAALPSWWLPGRKHDFGLSYDASALFQQNARAYLNAARTALIIDLRS